MRFGTTDHLPRLPLAGVQVAQQAEAAVGELVAVFLLQTLAISRVDGGEVAAVHCRSPLSLGQDQRHQLWAGALTPSVSESQTLITTP